MERNWNDSLFSIPNINAILLSSIVLYIRTSLLSAGVFYAFVHLLQMFILSMFFVGKSLLFVNCKHSICGHTTMLPIITKQLFLGISQTLIATTTTLQFRLTTDKGCILN